MKTVKAPPGYEGTEALRGDVVTFVNTRGENLYYELQGTEIVVSGDIGGGFMELLRLYPSGARRIANKLRRLATAADESPRGIKRRRS